MQAPLPTAVVDSTVAAVLAREELAVPRGRSLLEAVFTGVAFLWDRAADFFRWLFPDLDGSEPGWAVAAKLAALLMAMGAVWLLGRVLVPRLGGLRRRGRSILTTATPRPATAADWEGRARQAAVEGRWRHAVHALYEAAIRRLAEAGRVRLDAAKTPGDYRREVGAGTPVSDAVDAFLGRFEPLAFGGRPVDRGAYEGLASLATGLGVRV